MFQAKFHAAARPPRRAEMKCGNRPGTGRRRKKNAALCAALALSLCLALLSACRQSSAAPASSSAPSSEAPSSQAASSEAVSEIAAVSSEVAASSEAAISSAFASSASSSTAPAGIVYENKKYGLHVALPSDWKGYKVLTQKWAAFKVSDPAGRDSVFGPELVIRNPKWTQAKPYQDIPIMIFTASEWDQLSCDVLHIGAAPVGPRELAKNLNYVFALPARYNYAFPAGYEEVDRLIDSGAVTAFDPAL